ncbi:hypothetical protein [Novosphingobium sp.]|uniref:hypothetical protein n=1 Tax=Novosphingobium sp. TaxID=1874826 RepID=UPI0031E48ED3
MNRELVQAKTRFKELDAAISQGKLTDSIRYRHELAKQEVASAEALITRKKRLMEIEGSISKMQKSASAYRQEGMATLMGAAVFAAPVAGVAHAAGEFQAMQNKMHILGLGDKAVDELTAYSKAMGVAGSSAKDNMRYLLEAQGAFRESGEHTIEEQLKGAKLMAPYMAKMAATLKASGHEMSEDQERYFLRFVEQAGGTTDTHRAASLTDGLFRAIQSSGGTVDAAAYQGFLARAGTAGMKLSARTMFADFEPLIAEMHDSAGVGLQSAYSRMNGMVKNQAAASEMLRLGLWNKDAIIYNKVGGIKAFKNGANPMNSEAAASLSTDPVEFYRKYVLPAYQKRGVKDVERENMLLFGKTGGALFNLINKQLPTILRSREAFEKTQSLDQAYNQTKDSFFGQGGQLKAAAQDFLVAAGGKGGLLENMTGALRMATGAVRGLTDAANAHPTAFRWIGTAVMALVGMRLATGAAKLAFGGLLGPVAQLWGAWSKFRAAGTIAAAFPQIATAFNVVRGAALFMARGVAQAGAMMLANPMVLLWTGIAVAVGVAAYEIYNHWDEISGAFSRGWNNIKSTLGEGVAWVKGKWNAFSEGISGFFEKHWTRIRNVFLTAMVIFTPMVAALVWAGTKIYNNWDRITAAFREGWDSVKAFCAPAVAWLRQRLGAVAGVLVWLGGKAYEGWGAVSGAFSQAWTRIKAGFGEGIDWVKGRWTGFTAWLSSTTLGKAVQWGADIASGAANGIKKFGAKAMDAAGNMADNVGGNFANQLQIRSPSRVFMAYGGHIASGLAIGLDRSGHHPVHSMRRVATAVVGAGAMSLAPAASAKPVLGAPGGLRAAAAESARAPAASRGPVKFEIHIHQQPGENADALADRVMRKIHQATRAKGHDSYGDDF